MPYNFARSNDWQSIKTRVHIQAERETDEHRSVVGRWHISSRSGLDTETALASVRALWGVENGLHWSLDVVFNDDQPRVRANNAAENLAVARHAADHVAGGIARKRKKAGYNTRILASTLNPPAAEVPEIT